MDNAIRPSWEDIHTMTSEIGSQVWRCQQDKTFQRIVGVARGGLIPAVILSHELGLPFTCIDYSSLIGAGDDRRIERVLPQIKDDSILIVDDIADTGHTLFEVGLCYLSRGHSVATAALYWKKPNAADFVADFYCTELPSNAPWVVFPWE